MKRLGVALLLLAAGVAVFTAVSLPPEPLALTGASRERPLVRGAVHVHSQRSDGTGTVESIAAAAARAGLTFVVLTDHGDATRDPDLPVYRGGVLMIEAVEISTNGGHVVAIGMPRSPYPLAGDGPDVVEDIARLGGMSIAAHPGSEKAAFRWVEWAAPIDGLEWLNGDSEWRDERPASLARALLTYPVRAVGSLASALDRPDAIMRRWDVLTGRRRVVALAAADAHARLSLRGNGDEQDSVGVLHLPSYEQMFRAFSITLPSVTLTGDAAADAKLVIDAIRGGRFYSSIDAVAAPAVFAFTASRRGVTAHPGGIVPPADGRLTLSVTTNAPPNATITLRKNGEVLATGAGATLAHDVPGRERAVYRVEIALPEAPGDPPVPWIVSNPIWVGDPADATASARRQANEFAQQYDDGFATDWTVVTSPRSKGALDVVPAVGGTQLSMRWALGGARSESPYAALIMPAGPALSGYDRIMFTGRATAPMRVSVQIRVPEGGPDGERWHQSVYLDAQAREVTIFFDDMTPRGPTSRRRPVLSNVRDVMFVVETVNTKPGASGQIWIDDVKYGR